MPVRSMKVLSRLLLLTLSIPLCAQEDARGQGTYRLVRALDPSCRPYTNNLNATASMDFAACHSRLTDPRFGGTQWTEVPLDLRVAEKIVKGILPKVAPQRADPVWHQWLNETEAWRAHGKVKMWEARIDIDGNGELETVVRLTPAFTDRLSEDRYCLHTNAYIYLIEANKDLLENFNRRGWIGDLIRDNDTGHYLLIERSSNPAVGGGIWGRGSPTWLRNAAGGVAVYKVLPTWGPIAVCNIQWVPGQASRN